MRTAHDNADREWLRRLRHFSPAWAAGLVSGPALAVAAFLCRLWPPALRPTCLFHAVTGLPCLTCGAFRCAELLARGALRDAWLMQPLLATLAIAAAAVSVYSWLALVLPLPPPRVPRWSRKSWLAAAVLAALLVLVNWAYLIAVGR